MKFCNEFCSNYKHSFFFFFAKALHLVSPARPAWKQIPRKHFQTGRTLLHIWFQHFWNGNQLELFHFSNGRKQKWQLIFSSKTKRKVRALISVEAAWPSMLQLSNHGITDQRMIGKGQGGTVSHNNEDDDRSLTQLGRSANTARRDLRSVKRYDSPTC